MLNGGLEHMNDKYNEGIEVQFRKSRQLWVVEPFHDNNHHAPCHLLSYQCNVNVQLGPTSRARAYGRCPC